MLYGRHLGYKGNFEKDLAQGNAKALELANLVDDLKRQAATCLKPKALWQFFEAERDGNATSVRAGWGEPDPLLPSRGGVWGELVGEPFGGRVGVVGVWLGAGGTIPPKMSPNPVRSVFLCVRNPLSRLGWVWATGWTRLCENAAQLSVGCDSFIDDLILAGTACAPE